MRQPPFVTILTCMLLVDGLGAQQSTRKALDLPEPETFELVLHCTTGFGRRSLLEPSAFRPVGGITLDIGIGREADVAYNGGKDLLGQLTTDESGFGTATLAVPVKERGPMARIWLRVNTPGFTGAVALARLGTVAEGVSIPVGIHRGASLLGEVTSAEGISVPRARVWLFKEGGPAERPRSFKTSARGRFRAIFQEAGEYTLHVRSGLLRSPNGSASLKGVRLDPDAPPDPLSIQIEGSPPYRGQVVDPDGVPVRGAYIFAIPHGLDDFPTSAQCARSETQGGLLGGCARVDVDGEFVLPALLPGKYDMRATFSPEAHIFSIGLGRDFGRWRTLGLGVPDGIGLKASKIGTSLAVVEVSEPPEPGRLVFPIHRLEVRATDPSGAPVDYGRPERTHGRIKSLLEVTKCTGRASYRELPPIWFGDLAIFAVEPESDYVVSWNDPHRVYSEALVHTGRRPWRTSVKLRLSAPTHSAKANFHLLDPSGAPLDNAGRVTIHSHGSDRVIESSRDIDWDNIHESKWSVDLPPGRYRARVTAAPKTGCFGMDPTPRAQLAPVTISFVLEPGDDRSIEARLQPAGHLDLVSIAPPAGPRREDELGPTGYPSEGRIPPGAGRARLISSTGAQIPDLEFDVSESEQRLVEWIAPGWTARCMTPIPPGRWTLVVEGLSNGTYTREFVVERGRTTVIDW